MNWLQNYHDDHMAVLTLLAKFEGNILALKAGQATPNTFTEFAEFGDVLTNVITPHFKGEETSIYVDISKSGEAGKSFTDKMLQEHKTLYELFDKYLAAVKDQNTEQLIEISGLLEHVLRHHIIKEEREIPKIMEGK